MTPSDALCLMPAMSPEPVFGVASSTRSIIAVSLKCALLSKPGQALGAGRRAKLRISRKSLFNYEVNYHLPDALIVRVRFTSVCTLGRIRGRHARVPKPGEQYA